MDRLASAVQSQVSAFVDDTATWVDPAGRTLSDRIWSHRQDMRARIDATIHQGILDGDTVDDIASELVSYVRPTYARYGSGKAQYAANRLAGHEMRRAHSLSARDVALTDPAGGFLRYNLNPTHVVTDECDAHADHNEGYGRGVYRAKECPLPPVHIGDRCNVEEVGPDSRDMDTFVEHLRVEYGLADPPDLSPDDLAIYRRETSAIREAVQFLFQAWFEQTGLVSHDQLVATSPTVRRWVEDVQREKRRRVRS